MKPFHEEIKSMQNRGLMMAFNSRAYMQAKLNGFPQWLFFERPASKQECLYFGNQRGLEVYFELTEERKN